MATGLPQTGGPRPVGASGNEVVFHGNLFIRPNEIVQNSIQTHTAKLSKEAASRIRARLDLVLQYKNTPPPPYVRGFYRSNIKTAAIGGLNSVSDSGVIYGPWLEGIGTRNASSSFKGYFTFRKIRQEMEKDAAKITKTETAALARELGR